MTLANQGRRQRLLAGPMNAGRRRLLAVLTDVTQAELGARVGVKQQSVSAWAAGEHLPGDRARERLWTEYGIPPELWPSNDNNVVNTAKPRAASPIRRRLLFRRWLAEPVARARVRKLAA